MTLKNHQLTKPILLFFLLAFIFCLPIWSLEYYVNQDGSPHLYNAYIILELLKGNEIFSNIYSINPYPIPNLTGHWIMAFLLLIFSPSIVSKLIVTITFVGLVASCGWLRWQTVGREGLDFSFLIGTAIAFNWLWFLGFYNFMLGLIGFAFTLGLYWKWREDLDIKKSFILALLILFVYFSHLISFGMLFGCIFVISILAVTKNRKQNYLLTVATFIPTLPLLISYRTLSQAGGDIAPYWRYLTNPYSISNWILQLQAGDPFQLISIKAFPFMATESDIFALFSSILWIFLTVILLSIGTWIYRKQTKIVFREKLPWIFLFIFSVLMWIVLPDDFGKSHGGFLRERVLLCGLVCFIPIYEVSKTKWLKIISYILLSVIILFQTAVMWEYSIKYNRITQNYLSARPYISDDDKLVSIVLIENSCRFKASPLTNLNLLMVVGKNSRIWDNYEIGYYLFPVVANNLQDQRFVYQLRGANAIELCNPNEIRKNKPAKLKELFENHHQKFSVLLVWNGDIRIDPIIFKWFEVEPFYDNGKVKLYRHK